jgi:hypothetical protein
MTSRKGGTRAMPEGFGQLAALVLIFWAVVGFTLWMAWG